MAAGGLIVVTLLAGGPELMPPPPTYDPRGSIEGPIEGPARPPQPPQAREADDDLDQADQIEPSVEFAPPASEAPSEAPSKDASQIELGQAPNDGAGALVAGSIIVPGAALALWSLLRPSPYAPVGHARVSIIVAGASMAVIGGALIGIGSQRRRKLQGWARARRVIAKPQGAGLLTLGGIAAGVGGSLLGTGVALMANESTAGAGAVTVGFGTVMLGLIAPVPLIIGAHRRVEYSRTGGWVRPALTQLELTPQVFVTPNTLGAGVAGRF